MKTTSEMTYAELCATPCPDCGHRNGSHYTDVVCGIVCLECGPCNQGRPAPATPPRVGPSPAPAKPRAGDGVPLAPLPAAPLPPAWVRGWRLVLRDVTTPAAVLITAAFAWGVGAGYHALTRRVAGPSASELREIQRCAIAKTLECLGTSTDVETCLGVPTIACLPP